MSKNKSHNVVLQCWRLCYVIRENCRCPDIKSIYKHCSQARVFVHVHSLGPDYLQLSSGPVCEKVFFQICSSFSLDEFRVLVVVLLTALCCAGGVCGRSCGRAERSQASWPAGHEWKWRAGSAGLRGRGAHKCSARFHWSRAAWWGCWDGTWCRCRSWSCCPASLPESCWLMEEKIRKGLFCFLQANVLSSSFLYSKMVEVVKWIFVVGGFYECDLIFSSNKMICPATFFISFKYISNLCFYL